MIKNTFFKNNKICFLSFFIIKEDRERNGENILKHSRTQKILLAKSGDKRDIKEMASWVFKEIDKKKSIIIIPFPSTDKDKPKNKQLPYLIVKELCGKSKKLEDGSGILQRAYSLPKNTRDIELQYKSLIINDPAIIKSKNVIILDDVLTSGSSLSAAIKKIEEAGSTSVLGLALAKKVHFSEVPLTGIF